MEYRPHILIGSACETEKVSYPIHLLSALGSWAEPTVWGSSIFELSASSIEEMDRNFSNFDACIFFITKDDLKLAHKGNTMTPKDIILLEVGLSIGKCGKYNTVLVAPKGEDVKFLTDMTGLPCAFFNPDSIDLEAEFKAISEAIRKCIKPSESRNKIPLTVAVFNKEMEALCKPFGDIQEKLQKIEDSFVKNIAILSGVEQCGILNIFPNRYSDVAGKSFRNCIKDELKRSQTEAIDLCIMGISLGDYFLDRGFMHNEFIEMLINSKRDQNKNVRTLIMNPKCAALRERARWEVAPDFYQDGNRIDFCLQENQQIYADSTTYIETDGAARIAQRISKSEKVNLKVKYYSYAPLCFLFLTDRFAYIENYTYAARGSSTPIIQVTKDSKIYSIYKQHFENIWDIAQDIEQYNPLVWPEFKNE